MEEKRQILETILLCEAADRGDYMRDYMRNRYHAVRDRVMKELGGKCARCGSTKDLQFDHIDSSKKNLRMADIHSVSDARLQKELKNIQILCRKCHHEKSHEAWDFNAPKPKHGTYWMYRKHGCRCNKCVKAYKKKQKEWRNSKKAKRINELVKLAGMIEFPPRVIEFINTINNTINSTNDTPARYEIPFIVAEWPSLVRAAKNKNVTVHDLQVAANTKGFDVIDVTVLSQNEFNKLFGPATSAIFSPVTHKIMTAYASDMSGQIRHEIVHFLQWFLHEALDIDFGFLPDPRQELLGYEEDDEARKSSFSEDEQYELSADEMRPLLESFVRRFLSWVGMLRDEKEYNNAIKQFLSNEFLNHLQTHAPRVAAKFISEFYKAVMAEMPKHVRPISNSPKWTPSPALSEKLEWLAQLDAGSRFNELQKLANQDYLYHETQAEHLADILNEGIQPMSYGQSFVGDQGEMLSPELFEEEELQDFPQEDLVPRTYVNQKEPSQLNYGNVLLRFPRQSVPLKRDVDWYTHHEVHPDTIEVRVGNEWKPLRWHVGEEA